MRATTYCRAALVLSLLLPAPVLAQANAACWYRDLEQVDRMTDPVQAGDNDFFTSSDVSPNLIWVLDNSGSMLALPCASGAGCSEYTNCAGGFNGWENNYFTSRGYLGYSGDATAVDASDPDYCTTAGDPRAFSGKDGCYKPGLVYRGRGNSCSSWPADGRIWKEDATTEAGATIENWCIDNYLSYPANPATSPTSCATDSQCPSGYKCLDPSGNGSVQKRCLLETIDCTTVGYVCPATYTCNTTTKVCEGPTAIVNPPSPFDTNNTCSSDSQCQTRTGSTSASTYLCRRSNGSTSSSPRYCYLGTHWNGAVTGDWANCTSPGYVCPPTYACNSTSKKCEKSVPTTAPHYSAVTSCTSDLVCPTGYRCLNGSGGLTGARSCRLPLRDCTTSGFVCADAASHTCNPLTKVCDNPDYGKCVSNLKTYGYAPGGDTESPVFTGDLLNFSPPKFVSGRKVLKDMVPKVQKTRQALFTYDNDDNFAWIRSHLGPTCDRFTLPSGESATPPDSEFTTHANTILTQINGIQFTTRTPMAETLTSACQYVTSDQNRWKTQVKFKTASGTSYTGVGTNTNDWDTETPSRSGALDSMCFTCQKNFVVMVTDGEPTSDTEVPSRLRSYAGTGTSSYLDDVADFCFSEDLRPDLSAKQNAVVHTVGFGIRAPILEDAALLGGGVHLSASDADELRNALAQIVEDVNKRATSFSVASVTTVQTRGSTYAFVPRFKPSSEELWEGHLYRFKLFNEFAAGCSADDTVPPFDDDKRSRNLNSDGDCSDVYLLDGNNRVVSENGDGDYMLADTTVPYDDATGWPVQAPAVAATPVWDAAEKLATRNLVTDPRVIHTVVDRDGDGTLEPSEQLAFHESNVDLLLPSLALGGAASDACEVVRSRLGLATITERNCAIELIKYIRGLDVFDEDKDLSKTDPRPRILADIFHSSPMLVTAPPPSFLCDLGLSTQCVVSLYSDRLTPKGRVAYQAWADAAKERKQFVLVGSNDGLLHAFHAGEWRNGDDPDSADVVETRHLDLGTGAELWSFAPPDMLPKLKRLLTRDGRHEILVDGTAMVRDVWVDAGNTGVKDADEFHTMAVVGERQGGRSWTALDVTNPDVPAFGWTWPPPGDREALASGETWNDFAPGAPPIGPVAIADTSGPIERGGDRVRERWVAFLNGGYDPSYIRGRSVSAVDVWTGQPVWRFSRSDATGSTDPRSSLGPVAATVSLLDLGPEATTKGRQDGFFDTAVVGDTLGQVWTLRFYDAGRDDDSDGLVDNWFGGRAFVQRLGAAMSQRNPFFQMAEASIAPDTGEVRVYLGSGDRPNIRERDGGECSLVNVGACVRKGCSVDFTDATVTLGPDSMDAAWSLSSTDTARDPDTFSFTDAGGSLACNSPSSSKYAAKVVCGSGAGPLTDAWSWGTDCDWDLADGNACVNDAKPDPFFSTIRYSASTVNPRFYSVRLFDGGRLPFTTATEAASYDSRALTDADLGNADAASGGSSDEDGYYIAYGFQDERTSSAASVLGGCVYWNTLLPDSSSGTCGAKIEDQGRLYRAHYDSGAKTCGSITDTNPLALTRATVRTAIVPPPPPTPVVSFNRTTGEVRYSMVTVEPSAPPAQVNVGAGDLAGTIYWLEVPREVHQCRHGAGNCR